MCIRDSLGEHLLVLPRHQQAVVHIDIAVFQVLAHGGISAKERTRVVVLRRNHELAVIIGKAVLVVRAEYGHQAFAIGYRLPFRLEDDVSVPVHDTDAALLEDG